MSYAFPPAGPPSVEIAGSADRFPVRRIYCVGRNYADHAREMGHDPNREPPFFFAKPADAVTANGQAVPYPPRTSNLHHEIELVVAIGKPCRDVGADRALDAVFGYAVGIDLTRRDLQNAAKSKGQPWETGKAFDHSAPISAIHTVADIGQVERGRIWLAVNGEVRQEGDVGGMTWSVPEVIAELSTLFELRPGDLIYTGTPAGVGPVVKGDQLTGGVEGVDEIATPVT